MKNYLTALLLALGACVFAADGSHDPASKSAPACGMKVLWGSVVHFDKSIYCVGLSKDSSIASIIIAAQDIIPYHLRNASESIFCQTLHTNAAGEVFIVLQKRQ